MRVLLIVDDPARLARVSEALEDDALEVELLSAGGAGDADWESFDLVVSDGTAAEGGLGVALRKAVSRGLPPVIVVAATDLAGVEALEAGAADYVVEPFVPRELRARAMLRARGTGTAALVFDELRIDRSARQVSVGGESVSLTPREYDLLVFLAERPGTVLDRETLLEGVWGASAEWQQVSTVTEHVYRLRRKIEADPQHPRWIVTVRATGYRFDL